MCGLCVQSVPARRQIACIPRTAFSNKSPRKESCGHAAPLRDILSLADSHFLVKGPLLRWRDCLCSVSECTRVEPDRLLSRLECFAHLQSRQSPPDRAGSVYAIHITMEPCSCTVSPLHGIVSSWSHDMCAVRPSETFTPPATSSYAANRNVTQELRYDWKTVFYGFAPVAFGKGNYCA